MKFLLITFILLFCMPFGKAQIFGFDFFKSADQNDSIKPLTTADFDFNPDDTIYLNDTHVMSVKLNTEMEKKYYLWLRKRVRDVWPFVKTAVIEYKQVSDSAAKMETKRERRKFIKERQKQLANQFEDKLKDLSTSRGQILGKLIYRETGKTIYDIIKELRGGFNAFLWNSAGGAYDVNLKQEFDPEKTREDLYIEVIVERDLANGVLDPIE